MIPSILAGMLIASVVMALSFLVVYVPGVGVTLVAGGIFGALMWYRDERGRAK